MGIPFEKPHEIPHRKTLVDHQEFTGDPLELSGVPRERSRESLGSPSRISENNTWNPHAFYGESTGGPWMFLKGPRWIPRKVRRESPEKCTGVPWAFTGSPWLFITLITTWEWEAVRLYAQDLNVDPLPFCLHVQKPTKQQVQNLDLDGHGPGPAASYFLDWKQ